MGVLGEKWCFCSGGDARTERVKGSIYTAKGPSIASVSVPNREESLGFGTGFVIHRGLLLTTHANIPSVLVAESGCEVKLGFGRIQAKLVPHRFFITSSILDLTIVALDPLNSDSPHQTLNPIKTGFNSTLSLNSPTFLLGHTSSPRSDLTIGEGKIVISTDNLIKLSTDGVSFSPGSAGFDSHGNLAFMLCDPMKLATSPKVGSVPVPVPVCGYSLSRKEMQFGVPVPVILDWLSQHWKGSLDEVGRPELAPAGRMVGQKGGNGESSGGNPNPNGNPNGNPSKVQLLDINFPPRAVPVPVPVPVREPRSIFLPLPLKHMLLSEGSNSNNHNHDNNNYDCYSNDYHNDGDNDSNTDDDEVNLMNVGPSRVRVSESPSCCSEVQSSSSPVHQLQYYDDGFSTGDNETMYSAETMESRNIPSPKRRVNQNPNPSFENNYEFFRVSVGRSQSCVNNTRWSSPAGGLGFNKGVLVKQKSLAPVRRSNSQAGPQRSQDFLSPTVSSAMKKRNSVEKEKEKPQKVQTFRAKQVQGPSQGPSKWNK